METWNQPNAGGSRGWNRERDPKRVAKFIYGREEVLGALGQEKLLIRCLTYIPRDYTQQYWLLDNREPKHSPALGIGI